MRGCLPLRVRLAAIAGVLALGLFGAACGPDCPKYCSKLRTCHRGVDTDADEAKCQTACNEDGSDMTSTISCVISHTCPDLEAGHCNVSGK